MKNVFFILGLVAVVFSSCNEDDGPSQAAIDEEIILKYLADSNITAQRDPSGVYYYIEEQGRGDYPSYSSYIKINYQGYLVNGNVFDGGSMNYYPLEDLILGWQYGIPHFRAGGKGKLFIPSGLGYGNRDQTDADGNVDIPANSVLIFDIHLVDFR